MVDTLKFNYPDAKVDFLVNERVYLLVQDYPNINKVHAIEKDSLRDILRICRAFGYDTVIVVRPLFSIALAAFIARIRHRLGTGYRWYSLLFNIRHFQHRKHSVKHELMYNLDLLDELGCKKIESIKPKLQVKESSRGKIKEILRSRNVNPSKDLIILHPGTLGSARRWRVKNFARLIELLSNDESCEFSLIVTGTNSDRDVLNKLVNEVGSKIFVIDDLNLEEFAALCEIAKMFVSNSTGPIHIAAAVGTFCIGFYSHVKSESEVRWGPCTDLKKIYTAKTNSIRGANDVMDSIAPEDVYKFIKNYMST